MQKMQDKWVQFLSWEDTMEEGMATHSNILAQRIPWTEEPGRLESTGSQMSDTMEGTEHKQVLCVYISLV